MSNDEKDVNPSGKGKVSLSRPGRLELKKTVGAGLVRQSFPHGRSRSVAVEVKRKRSYAQDERGKMRAVVSPAAQESAPPPGAESSPSGSLQSGPVPEAPETAGSDRLTQQERAARASAVRNAAPPPVLPAQHYAQTVSPPPLEKTAAKPKTSSSSGPDTAGGDKAVSSSTKPVPSGPGVSGPGASGDADAVPPPPEADERRAGARKGKSEGRKTPSRGRPGGSRRRGGKLTIAQALDERERVRSLAAVRRAREREKTKQKSGDFEADPAQKKAREVTVPETITVGDLANRMAARASDVVKTLMKMGVMATVNQVIDGDTAELVVGELGHTVRRVSEADVEIGLSGAEDDVSSLLPRPPVVTVMGHVDHGKTSLLDALRKTDVTAGEAGGITQHIGAYQIETAAGGQITFLDTPGHAAFTAMRSRGARATDVVVLVVAADDGIKAQTVEAINHARAAQVPIIVAINKIDVPAADADRVRGALLQHDLAVEGMGGDTLCVEVSAKQGTNLDKLEEAILLQAELLELRANPNRRAEGVVIESRMERGRGSVTTVLVQRGSLAVGDVVIAGTQWGKVRALHDDKGRAITGAGPSLPVEIIGLTGVPLAGDAFVVVDSEARAREVTGYRSRERRAGKAVARGSVEQMLTQAAAPSASEFPVVIKTDVHGSAEAIEHSLKELATEEVAVRVLHAAVGPISESDVTLAQASHALIIGFNVRPSPQARDMARQAGIDIRYHTIIYDVIDDIKAALSGMLTPDIEEKALGTAQIRRIFTISGMGRIAGCRVAEGVVQRGAKARLLRDGVVVYDGILASLRREKDEVREVKQDYECGIALENYNDVQEGDMIECYETKEVARVL